MSGPLARHFTLDPDVAFLNHGSFGACPVAVQEEQQRLRARMERQPVRFFVRDLEPLLDEALAALAAFLGCDADDLAFVANATAGVNTVLRSLALGAGDELLVTDHAYNACRNALDDCAARAGARVVVARVPFPVAGDDAIVEAVLAALSPRTRVALLDHVASPTGLVFPIARLVRELDARGVDTLVDGAHAPGMLPLALDALGAAYYTGNCHKWLCAPKGAAFLHVRRDRRRAVRPLVISHGANANRPGRDRFRLEFDWTGTDDPSPWLCVPVAIRVMAGLVDGGWPEVMARNHALALTARDLVARALDVPPPTPPELLGSLAALPFPDGRAAASPLLVDEQQTELLERYGVEVPLFAWPAPPRRLLRVSAQLYNDVGDYERLASAIREMTRRA